METEKYVADLTVNFRHHTFTERYPGYPPTIYESGLQLYIFNYPTVDAILVCVDPGSEKRLTKAAFAGIQVTISKDHPGSDEVLVNNWKRWRWSLECDIQDIDFYVVFVWEDVGGRRESPSPLFSALGRGAVETSGGSWWRWQWWRLSKGGYWT